MPNTLSELLDSVQPVIVPSPAASAAPNMMPPDIMCECQSCPEHEDTPCEERLVGDEGGGYLVERAGYSCIDCLPMMIEIGLAMTADSIEPEPNSPTYVRVANFESGAPIFS